MLNVCNYLFDLNFILNLDVRLDFEIRCRGIFGDVFGLFVGKNFLEVVNNIVWVR